MEPTSTKQRNGLPRRIPRAVETVSVNADAVNDARVRTKIAENAALQDALTHGRCDNVSGELGSLVSIIQNGVDFGNFK